MDMPRHGHAALQLQAPVMNFPVSKFAKFGNASSSHLLMPPPHAATPCRCNLPPSDVPPPGAHATASCHLHMLPRSAHAHQQVGMAPFLLLEIGTIPAYGIAGWLDIWNGLDVLTYFLQVSRY